MPARRMLRASRPRNGPVQPPARPANPPTRRAAAALSRLLNAKLWWIANDVDQRRRRLSRAVIETNDISRSWRDIHKWPVSTRIGGFQQAGVDRPAISGSKRQ